MAIYSPPNHIKRIETIWAFISEDETGEGVCGAEFEAGKWFPLITADENLVSRMRVLAQRIAGMTGKKVRLIKLTNREDLGEV